MKKVLSIILALTLVASLAACQSTDTQEPSTDTQESSTASESEANQQESQETSDEPSEEIVKGGTLDIAVKQEANTLLWTGFKAPEDYIQAMPMYEALMQVDETGDPQVYLCESVTGDAENLTYTIVLKQGIKFQDGSDLNAEACAWSLQMYKDNGRKSASFFPSVESIEATDDYTVVMHMSEWDTTIPQSLARECGYMFSQKAWETYGEEYCMEHPVGTGPFMMTEWNKDEDKTYVKFTDYWQGEPLLDEIVIHVYADSMVAQAALETGDLDAYYSVDFSLSTDMEEKGYIITTGAIPTEMPFLLFNSVNPDDPLNDINVRKALSHAIDQQTLCDVIYYGYATPTNQFAPEGSIYYSSDVVGYEYDPEKAKQMLADAGYPDGFSTTLGAKNEPNIVRCVTAIQDQLAQIGVEVELNIIDGADYGVALTGWDSGLFMHPTGLPTDIVQQSASMWVQGLSGIVLGLTSVMRPDDLNDTILEARSTASSEEAQELMKEAQVMMIDEYCMFWPIGMAYKTWILSPKLKDSGINEVQYRVSTLHLAWMEE